MTRPFSKASPSACGTASRSRPCTGVRPDVIRLSGGGAKVGSARLCAEVFDCHRHHATTEGTAYGPPCSQGSIALAGCCRL